MKWDKFDQIFSLLGKRGFTVKLCRVKSVVPSFRFKMRKSHKKLAYVYVTYENMCISKYVMGGHISTSYHVDLR